MQRTGRRRLAKSGDRPQALESEKDSLARPRRRRRISFPVRFPAVVLVALLVMVAIGLTFPRSATVNRNGGPRSLSEIPFDGVKAMRMLERIVELGPRPSGSKAMQQQQELLQQHFEELGGQVTFQDFAARHPQTGERVEMRNLLVEWHPQRKERILLCAHYDTRPYADLDPDPAKRQEPFLGANDGASGVAVLAVLGEYVRDLRANFGVDFIFFDAEEFVFQERRDPYFLGSEHFARLYAGREFTHRYRSAILLDMVGDADLQIYQERFGLSWRDSRPLIHSIWRTARRLGVREFVARPGQWLRDDHLALHDIARIPACNIIDFDYPRPGVPSYWHTTYDTPDKCSAFSLAKVGWVVWEWLKQLEE